MIFFLYGDDTFRSRAKKRELVEGFKQKRDATGMNVVTLDCSKIKEPQVFEELSAAPFLAEKRMVVLENLLSLKKSPLHKGLFEFFEQKKLPETTILVIWDEGSTFKSDAGALFDLLKKEKYAQEFNFLPDSELKIWILNEIKSQDGSIDPGALNFIVKHTQKNTWALHSFLEQLIAYARGRSITQDDVQIFLHEVATETIFDLVDAIIAKNSARVFTLIEAQYTKGEDSQFIFAMLLRQFRILLELSDLKQRKLAFQETLLAKELGLHPFVIKKSLSLVEKYSFAKLQRVYFELLQIDIKTKTGQGDQSALVDFFVGKLCLSSA